MRKTLLITILAFLFAINANSQCTIVVPSTHGYFVNVTVKATSVIATTPCVYGYNYNVAIEYRVTFTGIRIPSKLNTLQGNLFCGASPNFFSLPTTGGSGTVLSRSNVWSANTDCASASVSSLRCNTFELQIQGPGIENQYLTCSIVLPPVCYAGTNAPALNASTKSNICPASTVSLSNIIATNTPSNTVLEWHSATPVTALNKVLLTGNVNAGTYYAVFYDAINNCYSNSTPVTATVIPCCQAGSSAPSFRSTDVANICPSSTADLTSLMVTNKPAGAVLQFHTSSSVSASNKVNLASAVTAGTYYAVFYDAISNCYSSTTSVKATINACCNAGTNAPNVSSNEVFNNCPFTTASLSSITANNTPVGAILEWHTATPATALNKVVLISAVNAGTYYAVFYDALNNCYSNTTLVKATITACCNAGTNAPNVSSNEVFNNCPFTTASLSSITANNTPLGAILEWHSATPATALNKVLLTGAVNAGTYYAVFYDALNNCYSSTTSVKATVTPCCNAGMNSPNLSRSEVFNNCPSTAANLLSITANNTPIGAQLEWHSATPVSATNKIILTGAVNAGTYYAVFYDALNNCYSSVSTANATITPCCNAGNNAPNLNSTVAANICPLLTADLNAIVASNTPIGAILEFHSATPVSASNKVSLTAAVAAGTYYAVFYDAFNNCYSNTTAVNATITPCCNAGTIAPNLSATALVNTCPIATANLTTISANNTPFGAVLEWHTSANISASNKVNSLTSVTAGVYFAVFFDALNNCYSNASAAVNVAVSTCSGISSGNEGGLESDGCLAEAISKRNYQRIKTPSVSADGKAISFDNPRDLPMFNEPIRGALGTRGDAELESFIPLKPFANTATAFMTSPNDLIGVTNAKKVLSVDYFDNATQNRLAAVLTTKTSDKVYDHTKVICDRLIGSQLLSTQRIVLDNKPFIMSVLQRENGAIEYNINFSVNKVNATTATVTSQWAIDEYPSKPDYWNFQVWAQSPDLTEKLAIEILNKFKEQFATLNSTIEPSIPKVFVKKGSYDNGTLTLVIQNPIGAKRITLSGNYTSSETNKRETLSKTVTLSGANEETIELVVGSIFDFGFTLRNEKSTEYDALYFADGAWGLDYNKNVSKVESYEVNSTIPFFQDGVFTVERTPILRGEVKDYISLFRSLRPASQATNLSTYKNLSFKASGTSVVEVTLVKKSITEWSKQYRTEIKLYNEKQDYSLALKDFNNGTNEPIKADDLVDIVFTIKGDGKTSKPFEITVDNVVFDNKANSTLKAGAVLTAFPNPASESTELIFDMPERGVSEISLTNTNGKKVIQRTEEFAKGHNRIMLMLNTLPSGIYVATVITAKGKITAKVIIP